MRRHELLRRLHHQLQPRTYFEIGVRTGRSLTLSRVPSVGVDPFYTVKAELNCDLHLVRTTSDEFFARANPFAHFDQPVVDLAFIDGMHLAEFALRDFINTERYCGPASVIVIDDVLPRTIDEGGRGRRGTAADGGPWAGDVYKLVDVLRRIRPDLLVLELDTTPTGTLVVMLPDAGDASLANAYDDLVTEIVVPDPQAVPAWALTRSRALDPLRLLQAPIWDLVREAREGRPALAVEKLRAAYDGVGLLPAGDVR